MSLLSLIKLLLYLFLESKLKIFFFNHIIYIIVYNRFAVKEVVVGGGFRPSKLVQTTIATMTSINQM